MCICRLRFIMSELCTVVCIILHLFTILVHIIINTYYHMCVIVRELLNFYEFPGDDIAIIKYVRNTTSSLPLSPPYYYHCHNNTNPHTNIFISTGHNSDPLEVLPWRPLQEATRCWARMLYCNLWMR